ncbi:MAG: hypothetical protein RMJ98_15410, partial [Myxococcales bacterium]|nr:hypothetical protein [Polyangiaceae bacterium]MDW8250682.1 hypothetical protein [Myxococcales bacterium]
LASMAKERYPRRAALLGGLLAGGVLLRDSKMPEHPEDLLGAGAGILGRFGASLVLPPEPVLAFSPPRPTPAVAIVVLLAGTLLLSSGPMLLRRCSEAFALTRTGAILMTSCILPLAQAVVRGGTIPDTGIYVFLLGATLWLAPWIAKADSLGKFPTFLHLVPCLVALALVPLNTARSLVFRTEESALRATAAEGGTEGRLAQALLEPKAADGPFCIAYLETHGVSTRAHGCVARWLLALGRTEEALSMARMYARERINRPGPRRLLIETLLASGQREEAAVLVTSLSKRYPRAPDLIWARGVLEQ